MRGGESGGDDRTTLLTSVAFSYKLIADNWDKPTDLWSAGRPVARSLGGLIRGCAPLGVELRLPLQQP